MFKTPLLFLSGILLLGSCKDRPDPHREIVFVYPEQFGNPVIPPDNQLTPERIELGRHLFYDNRLSADGRVSCASCHIQKFAFSDTTVLSSGFHKRLGMRNAPGLTNVAYVPLLLRDGGVYNLEGQALVPIQDTLEMNNPITAVAMRIASDPYYKRMARLAYNREPDPYVIVYALAAFQRTMISADSKYDRYRSGQTDFSTDELAGYKLFTEALNCVSCHSGELFTDHSFRNNGLTDISLDSGRLRITANGSDRGKFRVPTLRNVALTGPFMHDGSYKTLEDVLDAYAAGGIHTNNVDNLIRKFALSETERDQIVAFLKTLTDSIFVSNPALAQP